MTVAKCDLYSRYSPYPPQVRSLTSLRFIAASWVLSLHLSGYSASGIASMKGYLGVDFFFLLSGWILSHVYLDAFSRGSFSYYQFLINRIARVYPLHVFFLCINVAVFSALAVSGLAPRQVDWGQLPLVLGLMHAWGFLDTLDWNDPSWSLSAEWAAYLAFPIYLLLTLKLSSRLLFHLSVCIFALAYFFTGVTLGRLTTLTYDFGVLRVMPEFLLGVAVYQFGRFHRLTAPYGMTLTLLCVLSIILSVAYLSDCISVFVLAGLIYSIAECERHGISILGCRFFQYLGKISYSLYLAHFIVFYVYFGSLNVLSGVQIGTASVWTIPPALFLVVLTALFGYHLIEVPFRHRIRAKLVTKSGLEKPPLSPIHIDPTGERTPGASAG